MSRENILNTLVEARKEARELSDTLRETLEELDQENPVVTIQDYMGRVVQKEHYWCQKLDKQPHRQHLPEISLMTLVEMIKQGLYDHDENNKPFITCEGKTSGYSGQFYYEATIQYEGVAYKFSTFHL